MEKVSVIVPSYKRDKKIVGRALISLIEQTYQDIEIILIDDNAKLELIQYRNELKELVKELNSDKIKYIENKDNLGSTGSRNVGIHCATSNYITFLDDDDRYLPKKIENQINFMLKNNLEMSFSNLTILNDKEVIVDFREFRRIKNFDNKSLLGYHLSHKITGTDLFMIKKEVLDKIGGFGNVDMGDEFYLMLSIINLGARIGYLDVSDTIAYRAGQDGLTVSENRLVFEKKLFSIIKSNYVNMKFSERSYARFRYNVTKFVTNYRAKNLFKSIFNLACAFFCSPISFFVEPIRMKKNITSLNSINVN